jgi:molybdopterin-guanine dinucleotide biosynthesis protein
MRVVSVSGARGSGKTTLIRRLIGHFSAAAKRSAVIVNEEGQAVYDVDFVRTHDLTVKYVRGG